MTARALPTFQLLSSSSSPVAMSQRGVGGVILQGDPRQGKQPTVPTVVTGAVTTKAMVRREKILYFLVLTVRSLSCFKSIFISSPVRPLVPIQLSYWGEGSIFLFHQLPNSLFFFVATKISLALLKEELYLPTRLGPTITTSSSSCTLYRGCLPS